MDSDRTPTPAPARIPVHDADRVVKPNFITEIIDGHLREGTYREVVTRFPPEPNGYLHIGHTKAICLDFGVADDYAGRTFLRFDDTNPNTEDPEYVEAIKNDIRWLGFSWDDERYASDYFETLYGFAVKLIEHDSAYVDSLSEEDIREYRGTVTKVGTASPYRNRPVEENLELFARMRDGGFDEGAHVLRAKIDMASPNMLMRDPLLYRIRHAHHYRTGDAWHVYPMYDFAHPLSDAIEGISHSLCTLEFENNRDVYDWLVERLVEIGELERPRPRQYEFARLNLDYTVLSKRKLIALVRGGHLSGWDDPRMPTIAGIRRRGATPEAVRDFANRVGYTKANSRTDYGLLEYALRDDLNTRAPRVMAVLEPLKVVLTNFDASATTSIEADFWPHDIPREGTRPVPFSRELWIERTDFSKDPPPGWRRLAPGDSVRLRHAYVITCDEVIEDADGEVTELRCTYHEDSLGGAASGVKVKGVVHWVAVHAALRAEFRLYDRLFSDPDPDVSSEAIDEEFNPDSLQVRNGYVEPSVAQDAPDARYQFERQGYFWRDPVDGRGETLVFNRIVTLKDTWEKRGEQTAADRKAAEATALERESDPRKPPAKAGEEPDPVDTLAEEQLPVFERYHHELGLPRDDAALIAAEPELAGYFEEALRHHGNPEGLANWIVNEFLRELKDRELADVPVSAADLAQLVALIDEGTINNRIAKEVFAEMVDSGRPPQEIVKGRGLEQLTDERQIRAVVDRVVAEHPEKVSTYRSGKEGLAGFFIGQVMQETRGRANPQLVRELVGLALVDDKANGAPGDKAD